MTKILILATDRALSDVLSENLSLFNFNIKTLSSPDHILTMIREYHPDVILIDFILQDSNGGSVCHQLKCNPKTKQIPVIILSEYPGFRMSSKKFGCDAMLTKPVSAKGLIAKINECLNKVTTSTNADKSAYSLKRLLQVNGSNPI